MNFFIINPLNSQNLFLSLACSALILIISSFDWFPRLRPAIFAIAVPFFLNKLIFGSSAFGLLKISLLQRKSFIYVLIGNVEKNVEYLVFAG